MKKIIGYGVLMIFCWIFLRFTLYIDPDLSVSAKILGSFLLFALGLWLVLPDPEKTLPKGGDSTVNRNPEMKE